ncbi:hypothetical protein NP233_g685 [Leucocoprinus birnbaumii]|uniref:FAD-binding FR-type domain-containing protein n=1 Tax=Leucocoprinus birnbaumii TaxID=56174 RepID=A0AAD5Z054_9AGAR|nr:hypothetical protein NP233_g685 [Leucocoprinus birnbaumii]
MIFDKRFLVILFFVATTAFAQASSSDAMSHGMDMDMDMGMVLAEGQMLPYLHFRGADVLWFQGWVPQSKGALAGTCIGIFLLAVLDRWLSAMRVVAELYWNKRAQIAFSDKLNAQRKGSPTPSLSGIISLRTIPPFIPSNDIARGLLQAAQSFLSFAFMLAAMTFNAGIIIAIVVGLGVGETLFGRYAASRSNFSLFLSSTWDLDFALNSLQGMLSPSHARQTDSSVDLVNQRFSLQRQSPGQKVFLPAVLHRCWASSTSMADTGTPPVVPPEFRQYDSYAEAPWWQLKFSMVWVAGVGLAVLFCLPHFIRGLRTKRVLHDVVGIREKVDGYIALYDPETDELRQLATVPMPIIERSDWRKDLLRKVINRASAPVLWTVPWVELNVGQMLIIIGYLLTVILCVVLKAPLIENPNRAGFITLAQFPVVFLFATKNSIVSLFLGPGNGYEKLNFIHRWAGRGLFVSALIHGSLWINNHLTWGFPIIGQQKETSGVAALGLLCAIVITSARPVRKAFYEFFYIAHTLAFVAFFVTVCYHTIYAPPWIFPPLAFYGLDMLSRFFRYRIKDATLTPIGNQFTMINIPFCTDGWTAGQHVRLRVFFEGRIFESHPLTIITAPPSTSCVSNVYTPGITLGARVMGDWSRALNTFALNRGHLQLGPEPEEKIDDAESMECVPVAPQTPVQVMIDGPYGGCTVDLGRYETVLLFAGGAGATFTLGLLDDIVGRCVKLGRPNSEKTRRIEFAWCIKSFGLLEWFAQALMEIARTAASSDRSSTPLALHISIYVTCLCDPEAVPPIPNCDVTVMRPDIYHILDDLVTPPTSTSFSPSTSTSPCQEKIPLPASAALNVNSTLSSSPAVAPPPPPPDNNIDNQEIVCVTNPGHVTTARGQDIDVESEDGLDPHASQKLPWFGGGGGVAVCASGPASLVREASNAVARLRLSSKGMEMGGVDIHTEVFTL